MIWRKWIGESKPWSVDDEKKLKDWVPSGFCFDALGFSFNGQYTKDAIYKKIGWLGLEVVDEGKKNFRLLRLLS